MSFIGNFQSIDKSSLDALLKVISNTDGNVYILEYKFYGQYVEEIKNYFDVFEECNCCVEKIFLERLSEDEVYEIAQSVGSSLDKRSLFTFYNEIGGNLAEFINALSIGDQIVREQVESNVSISINERIFKSISREEFVILYILYVHPSGISPTLLSKTD